MWSRMDPLSQQKFIDYHLRLDEEERRAQEIGQEGPLAMQEKTGSAPVIRSANHKQANGSGSCSASRQPLSPLKRKQSSDKSVASPKSPASPVIKSADVGNCNEATKKEVETMPVPATTAPVDYSTEVPVPTSNAECTPPNSEVKEPSKEVTVQDSDSS